MEGKEFEKIRQELVCLCFAWEGSIEVFYFQVVDESV
jgi:hypothetical protein